MATDYARTARELVDRLGGAGNVKSVTHCMTRLRFVLNDESGVDDKVVEAVPGVMGTIRQGGQYQVIIGNEVQAAYRAVLALGGISGDGAPAPKQRLTAKRAFNNVLDAIAGSMAPILPAIIGCGMIQLLLIVVRMLGVSETDSTYMFLATLGDAGFYFIPLMLAYTASKKFECSTVLSMVVVAVLLHPNFAAQLGAEEPQTFLGLPVISATYSSSVIPALLVTWVLSYVERGVDRITPGWTKTVFKPMLVLLVMMPVAIVALAPLGAIVGDGLSVAIGWLNERASWLTMLLVAGLMPFIIMTGMHYAFLPSTLGNLATLGFDNLFLPAMLCSNLAQGTASLAVAIRSKNRQLKSVAGASAATAMVAGITEPALYGVTLRLRRPLIAACVSSAVAGLFIGIMHVVSYSFAVPGLVSIVQFVDPAGSMNFVWALVGGAISIVCTFVLTLVLGWDDPTEGEYDETSEDVDDHGLNASAPAGDRIVVTSPVPGTVVDLTEVPDKTFSSGMLGHGLAVEPSEGRVVAPFDGVVETVFPTLHALGLRSDSGVSLLVHVGLETVSLEGRPFSAHVQSGEAVKAGQLLLEFDVDAIRAAGCKTVTPVLVCNEDEVGPVTVSGDQIVIGG